MNKLFLLVTLFTFTISLCGQMDPATMANLSKLSPEQKKQLQQKYGSTQSIPTSTSTVSLPNRKVEVGKPDEDSFNDRSKFLGDLNQMERMISADVQNLQVQLARDDSSQDNELLEALNESQSLLRKIKELQRREIEKRAEEFGKSEVDAIKPFGYDLFASDPSTFAPGNEVPIPSDYRIGPGDLLEIQLFGQQNESYSLGISSDGLIRFPGIGPINAFENGTTFLELKNHLKSKIREHLGAGVQSSISLGAFRSIRIFLLGEVRRQGAYTVSALSTMLNALLTGGGIKDSGSLRKIELKRKGNTVTTLDLYDLMLYGDTSDDFLLLPGDVIFVPVVKNQITISGSVRRPAKYETLGGETLKDAIELAGGVNDRAYLENIRLERLGLDFRPRVKNLQLPEDLLFEIQTGDIISISSVGVNVTNSVSLIGNVERPGEYEWRAGLRIRDLIQVKEDLLPKTDLNYGLVRRKNEDGTIKVLSFSPLKVLKSPDVSDNLLLEEQDALYFFPLDESRNPLIKVIISDLNQQKKVGVSPDVVTITGFVRHPGNYPLVQGMDLSDLITASGGLIDSSYTLSAELTRVALSEKKYSTVEHIEIIDLNSISNELSSPLFLQANDHLVIKKIPYWADSKTVTLGGEFMFPGEYRIKRGETLKEVIARAGGSTVDAYIKGAFFTREHIRRKETAQRQEFINRLENILAYENLEKGSSSDSSVEQSRALLSRLKSIESTGRLVIDLNKQLDSNRETSIVLLDGDELLLPRKPQEVTVGGEVQFPTSHLYAKGLRLNDFIEKSGGFTERSNEDRIALIKVNGEVFSKRSNKWFTNQKTSFFVEAGDMIIVPIKIELPSKFLENLNLTTQIIFQMAMGAAAINSF
jgi:polysaccharide export outer membrane protein